MRASATPKLGAYAGLAALGLLASLALELPELVAVAAPFALIAALGLALGRAPVLRAYVRLERERVLEGDEIAVTVDVEADAAAEHVELALVLPDGLSLADGANPSLFRLPAGGDRELEFRLRCERWGTYRVGELVLRTRDALGVLEHELWIDRRSPLRVYPRAEALRSLLRPLETQPFAGNQVARQKGDGIEFADLRQFAPGDRIRRINWRASARRGELWVNELHAERNADIVLFLDSFAEARGRDAGTLDLAVRAAGALAEKYLRAKDRVGLVSFGGLLNWLLPATGITQLYRIVDALLDTEIVLNYAWKNLDVIPRRTLPPQALIVALTPLLDDRAIGALLDLRARGFDLALVEISPVPFTEPAADDEDELAYRLWQLRRDARRARYEAAGVPVARWDEAVPLAAPLDEIRAFRRSARPVRA